MSGFEAFMVVAAIFALTFLFTIAVNTKHIAELLREQQQGPTNAK